MTQATTSTAEKKKSKAYESAAKDLTTDEERAQCLATCLYSLHKSHTFYCGMLQSMNITYSHMLPTAGVSFSNDLKRFELYLNPMYFCRALTADQRIAVMLHELGHLTNRHLSRIPFMKVSNHNRKLLNIAGDMSLNQYIKNLPAGCAHCPSKEDMKQGATCSNDLCPGYGINVDDYYDTDANGVKTPWPKGQTMEQYFLKLKDMYREPEEGEDEGEDGEGNGTGTGTPREFDSHDWDGSAEEKDMLEATEDLVKRAMIKTSTSYDNLPSHMQKLLEEINNRKAELDYKALLLSAIKRSATGADRKYTWTRKSRRFGNIAPGTKEGPLPRLSIVIDTSGSISIETMNDFLNIVDEFLKTGHRKCDMHLFSDKEYHSQTYKVGDRVAREMVRNSTKIGGTDLEDSMKNILKRKSDLTIIVTDGFYSDVNVESWLNPNQKFPQCLFVIESGGTSDHPFANRTWANTVKVPKS